MKISGTTLRPHSFARQKGAERKNGLFIGHRGFLFDQLPSVVMFTVYAHMHITTGTTLHIYITSKTSERFAVQDKRTCNTREHTTMQERGL